MTTHVQYFSRPILVHYFRKRKTMAKSQGEHAIRDHIVRTAAVYPKTWYYRIVWYLVLQQ